ncbi:MAG: hypothetical protein ACPF8V_11555 [Luteibaculum sp.]
MLEFTKQVLQKVSFDPRLFEKELRKGIRNLRNSPELLILKKWCYEKFYPRYAPIIKNCFA